MGAWGVQPLEDDTGADFGYDIEKSKDLSPMTELFDRVERIDREEDTIYSWDADMVLAACDILARIRGKPGYHNSYTEELDTWVAKHQPALPQELLDRAIRLFDRVVRDGSETRKLWQGTESEQDWLDAMLDLRKRLTTST